MRGDDITFIVLVAAGVKLFVNRAHIVSVEGMGAGDCCCVRLSDGRSVILPDMTAQDFIVQLKERKK